MTRRLRNKSQKRRVLIGFTGTAAGRSGGGLEAASEGWFVAKRLAYIQGAVRRFEDKREVIPP
jgi:hypothetical protein